MPTKVLLADDYVPFRTALRALLQVDARMQIVGEAGDGAEAVRLARELRPDVVVMDVSMPGLAGVEATRQIVAAVPGIAVIALSLHEEPTVVEAMRAAGACRYVSKGGDAAAITDAILATSAGPVPVAPRTTDTR